MEKPKNKKVMFVVMDHWNGGLKYVERRLDVRQELKPEGVLFSANGEEAYDLFDEIKADTNLVRKLNLKPLSDTDVDASLVALLISYQDSVKLVQMI